MANPIENKQLADALNEINAIGKSIEETFKGISEQAKKVGESSEDLAKNLDFSRSKDIKMVDQLLQDLTKRVDKLTESIKNREKATDILTKQEKTLIRLQKEQNESTQELAVSIEEVKLERQAATKAAKEQAKENQGLTLTIDKQRKRLNELQRELTNAAVEGRINEESLRGQREEFEKLFTTITEAEQQFGNFRRQVGNYEKASEDATRATEKLGKEIDRIKKLSLALGASIGAGGLVGRAIKSTEEGFDDLRVATEAVDVAINSVLAGAARGAAEGFKEAEKSSLTIVKVWDVLKGTIDGATESLFELEKVVKIQNELTRATIAYEKSLTDSKEGGKGLLTTLADQVELFEILTLQAERNSLSLEERLVLIDKAAKVSQDAFRTEKEIAQGRVELFETALQNAIRNGTDTQQILRELTQARLELNDVESRATQQQIQNAEIRNQLLSDQKELELDILIDSFDTQKTINERIVADTNKSFDERSKLLEETQKQAQVSFEAQKQVILELIELEGRDVNAKERTDRAVQLNAALEKTVGLQNNRKASQSAINDLQQAANDLQEKGLLTAEGVENVNVLIEKNKRGQVLNEQDLQFLTKLRLEISKEINQEDAKQLSIADKLNQFIKADAIEQVKLREELGISEKISTRLLEISRERRITEQDLLDITTELNKSAEEFSEIDRDIADQQDALDALKQIEGNATKASEVFDELEKERLENQKQNLEIQLKNVEEGSLEELKIKQELNDLLLKEEKDRIAQEQELQEEALDAIANGAEFVADQLTRLSEARVQNIENEIDALSRTEDRLREDIANGAELAGESLTGIQEKRDALALEREQELKKQARLELLVAGSQLIAQAGSFEEAASDIVKLQTLISSILRGPQKHDGGYTGDGGEWDYGGFHHKGEFINTARQVKQYGMRGWDASDFDKAVQSGYFNQFSENISSDYLNHPIQFSRPTTTESPKLINAVYQVTQAVLKSIDDKPEHDKRWIEESKEMEYKISTKTRVDKERIKSFRY